MADIRTEFYKLVLAQSTAEALKWLRASVTAHVLKGKDACKFFSSSEASRWIHELIEAGATELLANFMELGWRPEPEQLKDAHPTTLSTLLGLARVEQLSAFSPFWTEQAVLANQHTLASKLAGLNPPGLPVWVLAHFPDAVWVQERFKAFGVASTVLRQNPACIYYADINSIKRQTTEALAHYIRAEAMTQSTVRVSTPLARALITDEPDDLLSQLLQQTSDYRLLNWVAELLLLRPSSWMPADPERKEQATRVALLNTIAQQQQFKYSAFPVCLQEYALHLRNDQVEETKLFLKVGSSLTRPVEEFASICEDDIAYLPVFIDFVEKNTARKRIKVVDALLKFHKLKLLAEVHQLYPDIIPSKHFITQITRQGSIDQFKMLKQFSIPQSDQELLSTAIEYRNDSVACYLIGSMSEPTDAILFELFSATSRFPAACSAAARRANPAQIVKLKLITQLQPYSKAHEALHLPRKQ